MPIKRNIQLMFKTNDGSAYPIDFSVHDGKSSYEVWLEQPGNAGKTEHQYFEDLTGPRGDGIDKVSISVTVIP